jgi:phage shock protein PspC (stress-responsive transcriptional regulator)
MERVVTINLNGNSYQLDESAFDALRAYLERAEAALAANPDKAEILRDLEQAIADKCAAFLSASKSVISAAEIATALEQMGPVEGEAASTSEGASDAPQGPKKRIYRIRDDAKVAGVCAGIGAYFDIDANLVRLLFVVLAIFTHGFFILVYVAMMFLIPSAHTSEEWAAAHGVPFNAQEVIDRAKRQFADGQPWRWGYDGRASWRRAMRERVRARRAPAPMAPVGPFTRVFGGLFALVFSLLSAALAIAFLVALYTLFTTGIVLGWAPPTGVPIWMAFIVLCVIYGALAGPLGALQGASVSALTGQPSHNHDSGFGGLIVLCVVGWLAYTYVPEARVWMDQMFVYLRLAFDTIREAWTSAALGFASPR